MKKWIVAGAALSLANAILLAFILYALASGPLVWNNGEISVANLTSETVRLADNRFSAIAGSRVGQGALTLFDRATDKQFVELGFYEYGAGIFTPHRFEFWTGKEVSVAGWGSLPVFQVRNKEDTDAAVWLNGARYVGSGRAMSLSLLKFAGQASLVDEAMLPS